MLGLLWVGPDPFLRLLESDCGFSEIQVALFSLRPDCAGKPAVAQTAEESQENKMDFCQIENRKHSR